MVEYANAERTPDPGLVFATTNSIDRVTVQHGPAVRLRLSPVWRLGAALRFAHAWRAPLADTTFYPGATQLGPAPVQLHDETYFGAWVAFRPWSFVELELAVATPSSPQATTGSISNLVFANANTTLALSVHLDVWRLLTEATAGRR